jgi:hypothetical protein
VQVVKTEDPETVLSFCSDRVEVSAILRLGNTSLIGARFVGTVSWSHIEGLKCLW